MNSPLLVGRVRAPALEPRGKLTNPVKDSDPHNQSSLLLAWSSAIPPKSSCFYLECLSPCSLESCVAT